MENVIRIPPNQYIHVLDNNKILTRLETGPQTFIRREHEQIVEGPTAMINLPPRTYCKINNPVLRENKVPSKNEMGEVQVQQGEIEYRTAMDYTDPFPLYPGEKLAGKVENLKIIQQNNMLRLQALRDFVDKDEVQHLAGEEWQITGPFTYIPRIEENIMIVVSATVIRPNTALRVRALRAFTNSQGVERKAGEEWLVREVGSFLPETWVQIQETVKGKVLSDKICLHFCAISEFVDFYGIQRLAGQEWLITNDQAQVHIQDVYEQFIASENAITLSRTQYCVVLNPYDASTKKNAWGTKVLVKGEKTFFSKPGEILQNGIEQVYILTEEEALLLTSTRDHSDIDNNFRSAGQRWTIRGPREYIPSVDVKIIESRRAIPLDSNEGIYVRDMRTGEVREVKGETYLLEAHEHLWEKHLPADVEGLVRRAQSGQPYVPPKVDAQGNLTYGQQDDGPVRDKTRIISFRAPHNSAIQLYDFKLKRQRVIFGPDLVMLGPDEQFTQLKLSGGKPKRENVIQTLQLSLGPDFMTDQIIVETSDHAKLALTLSYNWHFEVDKENPLEAGKLFAVKDFVGDACKAIGARVRGAVSSVTFEDFHHNSSIKIKEAVFGRDKETNNIKTHIKFASNLLVVTSVDIQGQEITDERTRRQLAESINQAIEINSRSQEMSSRHQAEKLEQEARGQLQRQKLLDQAKAEETKIKLLEQQAESLRVKAEGEAVSEAYAEAIKVKIRGEAEVNQVKLRVQALQIESEAELDSLKQEQEMEHSKLKGEYDLEAKKAKDLSQIEINKFKQIVNAIGKETLVAMARAGPETKAKLLQGLGLKGYLVTDGKNPINLFNTANGFIGQQ